MRRSSLTASAALLVFSLGSCSSGETGGAESGPPTATRIVHMHGLGIDPADGALFAATHEGLFRIAPTGIPEQVGPAQDTMGFTVVGPHRFLGSGHPAPGTKDPGNLGLIASEDAGMSWHSLSLSGEVDFHALHTAGSTVLGWDSGSGALMSTTDRVSWTTLSTLGLADFAADPANPSHMVATTRTGLARSNDGGRHWAPQENSPVLYLLTWATADQIIGVTPEGGVMRSADSAITWTAVGRVSGQPEALTSTPQALYLATDSQIARSTDQGRTWQVLYRL